LLSRGSSRQVVALDVSCLPTPQRGTLAFFLSVGRRYSDGAEASMRPRCVWTRLAGSFFCSARLLASGLARGSAGLCVREAPSLLSAKRSVTCLGDLQRFDFERLPPFAEHALSGRDGEADAHQLCQLVVREAVHTHNAFGAASRAATNQQSKRAAQIGLWVARHSGARHPVMERHQPILAQRPAACKKSLRCANQTPRKESQT